MLDKQEIIMCEYDKNCRKQYSEGRFLALSPMLTFGKLCAHIAYRVPNKRPQWLPLTVWNCTPCVTINVHESMLEKPNVNSNLCDHIDVQIGDFFFSLRDVEKGRNAIPICSGNKLL